MCENGVGYQVSFDPIRLSNLEHNRAGSVYAIAFAPKNEAVSALKYDQRIKDTIISSITAFILQNGVAVAFICENGDNREKTRYKLFEKWSTKYLDPNDFGFAPRSIEYADNMVVYGGVI